MFSVAIAMQQLDPFILLTSYNVFTTAVNNTNDDS
jgi:hypothetical protein